MNMNVNPPTTISAWTRLAPARFRDRNRRRGSNGVRAVACRATNPATRASDRAPSPTVRPLAQPCSADPTMA